MAQAHKLRKAKSLFSTTLSASISTGTGETITLASVSGLPTDTEITLTLDRVDSNGAATPAKLERITGIISGSNLTSYTRGVDGTTEQSHSSGAVIEYIFPADDWNDHIDAHLAIQAQDGNLKSGLQINDTSSDHQYVLAVSELAADRTVTLPILTGNDEFTFKDVAQTLTNKTLTSPTLNTPTLTLADATTLTTDGGIKFDRTNEKLLVGDGANTQSVKLGAWTTFTPTLTVTGGTAPSYTTFKNYYTQVGKLVTVWFQWSNTSGGTAGSGTNPIYATLPVTRSANYDAGAIFGTVQVFNSGGIGGIYLVLLISANNIQFSNVGAYVLGNDQNNANRNIEGTFTYEAA